jgi:hypothetical protein
MEHRRKIIKWELHHSKTIRRESFLMRERHSTRLARASEWRENEQKNEDNLSKSPMKFHPQCTLCLN